MTILFLLFFGLVFAPLTLLKGGTIYTPSNIGKSDILFGGTKILQISPTITLPTPSPIDVITLDVTGHFVVPGFVDVHVHVTGGGGENGPYSRTPEAQFDQIFKSGTTTLVGLLGTDGVSRSLSNLLVKLNGLEELGLSTYMWSGNYHTPPPTLTGSVLTDIVLVQKIIGFGEIAISDHRSSAPSFSELSRLVSDGRVAGLLSAKAGVTYFHVGSGKSRLFPLFDILEQTDIPITQMYPTHMSDRGQELLDDGKRWIQLGGHIDLTADDENSTTTAKALLQLFQEGIPLDHVSLSSDAYGSLPIFDSNGQLIGYDYQRPDVLHKMLKKMVFQHKWSLLDFLPLITKNPATFLGLKKGEIKVDWDADLVVLDRVSLEVLYVISRGSILKTPTWIKPPPFKCE